MLSFPYSQGAPKSFTYQRQYKCYLTWTFIIIDFRICYYWSIVCQITASTHTPRQGILMTKTTYICEKDMQKSVCFLQWRRGLDEQCPTLKIRLNAQDAQTHSELRLLSFAKMPGYRVCVGRSFGNSNKAKMTTTEYGWIYENHNFQGKIFFWFLFVT